MNRLLYVSLASLTVVALAVTSGCASPAKTPTSNSNPDTRHENATAGIAPVKDPAALSGLKKMGDALASAKTMSFVADTMTPIRGANNQWVHVFSTAKVEMKRPNKIFIQTGGDSFAQDIRFDGEKFSSSSAKDKLYSQIGMAGTIDSMLAQASQKAGDTFSFSDVLLADPLSSWTMDLDGATYIGESTRGGEKLQHLALTAKDVDWEVWVDEKTHLPRIVYVKFTGETRTPTVLIEFSHWKLNADISDATFKFKAPKGFKKIEVKTPEGMSK
jgi:hypothetical protein